MTYDSSIPDALSGFPVPPARTAPLSSVRLHPRPAAVPDPIPDRVPDGRVRIPERRVPHTVTHAPYRREPYVRFRTPSSVIDGKAAAWTRVSVLLHWIDDAGRAHNRWVPAENVRRVARDDSSWQDPYDDWSFYYPEPFAGSSADRLPPERLSTAA